MNQDDDIARYQRDLNAFLDEYEARNIAAHDDPAALARELHRLGIPVEQLEKCRQRLYRLALKESKSHEKASAFADSCIKAMIGYKRKNPSS